MATVYKIVDRDLSTVSVVVNARGRDYSQKLNNDGEAHFTVSTHDTLFTDIPGLLSGLSFYGLIIERDGVKVFGGELTGYTANITEDDPTIEFIARSWLAQLDARLTPKLVKYGDPAGEASVDAGAIAWDLVDSTQKGWAVDLDGVDDYLISELTPNNLVPATNKITVGGWFYFTDPIDSGKLVLDGSGNGSRTEHLVAKEDNTAFNYVLARITSVSGTIPSDKLRFVVTSNGSTQVTVDTGAYRVVGGDFDYLSGLWFVIASWDGAGSKLIINAWNEAGDHIRESFGDGTVTGTIPATMYSTEKALHLGRAGGSLSSFFDGKMDDVFITNDYHDSDSQEAIRDGDTKLKDLNTIGWWRFDSGTDKYTFDSNTDNYATRNDLKLINFDRYVEGIRGNIDEYDFGFTEGTIETTQDRDRQYENKKIGEAIRDLTAVEGGFDFEITPLKVFNVYEKKGTTKETIVFQYPGNIGQPKVDASNDLISNEVIAIGEGTSQGADQEVLATHGVNHENISASKLRQSVYPAKDVSILDTLREKAAEELRYYSATAKKYSFDINPMAEPSLGAYELGDICRLKISDGVINENTLFRIYGITVTLNNDDVETVKLDVSTLV